MKKIFSIFKNKEFLKRFIVIISIILVIGGFYVYGAKEGRVYIDNSLVQAPITSISPVNPGSLQEMDVYEGQNIKKGDPIAVVGSQTLRADTDGLITMISNQIGTIMNAQTPVAQMIDPTNMRIAGTLDENKGLSNVRIGQPASFTVDAISGKTFWGFVDEVSPTAKQTQLSFSISSERPTQQFVVYVKYDAQKYPEIKNGMSAKLTIFTKTN